MDNDSEVKELRFKLMQANCEVGKTKAFNDVAKLFCAEHMAWEKHVITCTKCRNVKPTLATCALGFTAHNNLTERFHQMMYLYRTDTEQIIQELKEEKNGTQTN